MYISEIKISNFRNLGTVSISCGDGCNVFTGKNAQGKTNLLEALSVAMGRSFRAGKITDFFTFGGDDEYVYISLIFNKNDREYRVEYEQPRFTKGYTRIINDVRVDRSENFFGNIKFVSFLPEHLNIVKGNSDDRRRFIDLLAQMNGKAHRKALIDYEHARAQLRQVLIEKNYHSSEYREIWMDGAIRAGINLTFGRMKYFNLLKEKAAEIYDQISGGEVLTLKYVSNIFDGEGEVDFSNYDNIDNYYQIYQCKLNAFFDGGDTRNMPGVHRDDLRFFIGGQDASRFASQGQAKSVAISLKLAESEIMNELAGEMPVLLLDEIFAELDYARRGFIFDYLKGKQSFITSCEEINVENKTVFVVEDGGVQ